MQISKIYYVVENLDSFGFFLSFDYTVANPSFTKVADDIARLSTKELAEDLVKKFANQGFTMKLMVRTMEVTHKIF